MANSEAVSYGRAVAARLQEVLGEDLHGAYLSGSVALGGYVPLRPRWQSRRGHCASRST